MVKIEPALRRLAELWQKKRYRELTESELLEMTLILNLNVNYWWERAYLENQSLLASMTNDVDWQHEICLEIDRNK